MEDIKFYPRYMDYYDWKVKRTRLEKFRISFKIKKHIKNWRKLLKN